MVLNIRMKIRNWMKVRTQLKLLQTELTFKVKKTMQCIVMCLHGKIAHCLQ